MFQALLVASLFFTQVFATSSSPLSFSVSSCGSKENYETISDTNSLFNSPVGKKVHPYKENIRLTKEALNDKFRKFSSRPETNMIPWRCLNVIGWPESVKSIKATHWTRKDIDAIMEALPDIRFEWKNQKRVLIKDEQEKEEELEELKELEELEEEESLNQPLKLQKLIPDIDLDFLAQDGWGVPIYQ